MTDPPCLAACACNDAGGEHGSTASDETICTCTARNNDQGAGPLK